MSTIHPIKSQKVLYLFCSQIGATQKILILSQNQSLHRNKDFSVLK